MTKRDTQAAEYAAEARLAPTEVDLDTMTVVVTEFPADVISVERRPRLTTSLRVHAVVHKWMRLVWLWWLGH